MHPHVRVVIQARMGSSRRPGKILASLAGEPLLAHVVRRMRAAGRGRACWEVMVATTASRGDDVTEKVCAKLKVRCLRGPEHDVLARYVVAAADLDNQDVVVRATADNPLFCPRRAALIVDEHLAAAADYTCIRNLSYVVPEVMTVGALRAMEPLATDAECREHVTPYFRRHPERFRVLELPEDWAGLRPEIRLTVDTPDELERAEWIYNELGCGNPLFSLEQVYSLWRQRYAGTTYEPLPVAAG